MNRLLFGIILFSLCSACTTTVKLSEQDSTHILALKKDGYTYKVDVTDDKTIPRSGQDFEATKLNTQKIVTSYAESGRDTMIIFLHGGLNRIDTSIERATGREGSLFKKSKPRLIDRIEADTRYYPVFLNWESGGWKTWTHQSFRIRRGVEVSRLWGGLTFLVNAPIDVVKYVVDTPFLIGQDISLVTAARKATPTTSEVSNYNLTFQRSDDWLDSPRIFLGEGKKPIWRSYPTRAVPGVMKIATTGIVANSGKAAWNNMLRRTEVVFDAPLDHHNFMNNPDSLGFNEERLGGFNLFIYQLKEFIETNTKDVQIILVGHSMGTIVINELLQRHPDLPVTDIVFMAAACSINDFNVSIVPFLQKNPETTFYNLTLHPIAERQENSSKVDFAPRGSLLEWIDRYYTNPETFDDLTFGKFNNALKAFADLPNDIRDQVYLKGFGMNPENCIDDKFKDQYPCPRDHGKFSEMPYWDRTFWQIPKSE